MEVSLRDSTLSCYPEASQAVEGGEEKQSKKGRCDKKQEGLTGRSSSESLSLPYSRVIIHPDKKLRIRVLPPPRRLGGSSTRPWNLQFEEDSRNTWESWAVDLARACVPCDRPTYTARFNKTDKEAEQNAKSASSSRENLLVSCGIKSLASNLESARSSLERLKFAMTSYIGAAVVEQQVFGMILSSIFKHALAAVEVKLAVTKEKETLSREQFNELSKETAKSKETLKISRRLRFLTTKTEPFVKTLDQKREERALALRDLENVIEMRNACERQERYLKQMLCLFSIEVKERDYHLMLKLVKDGCLKGCFCSQVEAHVDAVLQRLQRRSFEERLATSRLWDVIDSAIAVENSLVDHVSLGWK